jgi:hypothetical protein
MVDKLSSPRWMTSSDGGDHEYYGFLGVVILCSWEQPHVSEIHMTTIFRVKEGSGCSLLLLVSYMAHYSTLKMEKTCSSKPGAVRTARI